MEGDSLFSASTHGKDADRSERQEDIPRSGAGDLALNLAERNCLLHFPANYGVIIVAKVFRSIHRSSRKMEFH